jgi:DNA-directed RNA polymerase beta subunit
LKGLIRSITEEDPFPKSVNLYMYKDDHIEKRQSLRITIPKISLNPEKTVSTEKNELALPIFIIFRALGIETDRQIIEYISGDADAPEGTTEAKINSILYHSLIDGNYILTQE